MAAPLSIVLNHEDEQFGHITGKITTVDPAAAFNVPIGFVPSRIEIVNATNPSLHIYQHGMGAGYEMQGATAGTFSMVTSNGITEYVGDASNAPGFTIGTDAVLNTAGDVLYFIAYK